MKVEDVTMAERFAGAPGQSSDRFPKQGSDNLPSKMNEVAGAAKGIGDQAVSAARDLKNKAVDMAESSTDALKGRANDFVDAAKGVASQAGDKLKETVDGQKTAGADYVHGIADAMRRASREFESDVPIAATYMRKAAEQVENVSQSIKNGDIEDLVRTAQSFARRQPTAFFGIAALAGFGVIRFLKSSSDGIRSSDHRGAGSGRQQTSSANVRYRDDRAL
jgi:ElaB/YqjD/DUF883 family membrane-anchored ribosome-binding protein